LASKTGASLFFALLCATTAVRADTVYISYGNNDNYVEKFHTTGVSGDNTDLGPIQNTTSDTDIPNGIAFDRNGNLYVANDGNGTITEFAPNGSYLGVYATGLSAPADIAFDQYGYLYVAENNNGTIVKIPPGGGTPTTFVTNLSAPQGLAFGPNGNLYVTDQGENAVLEITPSGQVSTFYEDGSYTVVNQIEGLAFDSKGNLYMASYDTDTIEEITPSGVPSVFASNGNPDNPTNPEGLYDPIGLAFDSSGDLYVANYHHTQVPNEPYEGHGISYIDEYSSTGTLINAFTGNTSLPGADPNLRDGNYIAIETNAGVPLLDPVPEPSPAGMVVMGMAVLGGFGWIRRRR
jgi:MYXO-CTERM domain-containing protein